MTVILRCLLLAAVILAAQACKQEPPAFWKEMKFPVRKGEILPGADADDMKVLYHGVAHRADLYREFRRALERGGYTFQRDGKGHDPPGDAYSAVFKKGAILILLTISGSRDSTVELRRLD